MNKHDYATTDLIEETRSRNNILWMDILRIALTFAPKDTKEILGKINANDKEISGYLEKLAK